MKPSSVYNRQLIELTKKNKNRESGKIIKVKKRV